MSEIYKLFGRFTGMSKQQATYGDAFAKNSFALRVSLLC